MVKPNPQPTAAQVKKRYEAIVTVYHRGKADRIAVRGTVAAEPAMFKDFPGVLAAHRDQSKKRALAQALTARHGPGRLKPLALTHGPDVYEWVAAEDDVLAPTPEESTSE